MSRNPHTGISKQRMQLEHTQTGEVVHLRRRISTARKPRRSKCPPAPLALHGRLPARACPRCHTHGPANHIPTLYCTVRLQINPSQDSIVSVRTRKVDGACHGPSVVLCSWKGPRTTKTAPPACCARRTVVNKPHNEPLRASTPHPPITPGVKSSSTHTTYRNFRRFSASGELRYTISIIHARSGDRRAPFPLCVLFAVDSSNPDPLVYGRFGSIQQQHSPSASIALRRTASQPTIASHTRHAHPQCVWSESATRTPNDHDDDARRVQ